MCAKSGTVAATSPAHAKRTRRPADRWSLGPTFATSGKFLRHRAAFEIVDYELNRRLAWKATSGARATTTWGFQPSGPSTRMTFTRVAEAHGLFSLRTVAAGGIRQ